MINLQVSVRKRNENIFGSLSEYNDKNEKTAEFIFKNNEKRIYKTFYQNGTLKSSVPFIDEKKHGLYKYFYPNGNLKISIPYRYHKIQGTINYYHDNGEISIKSSYKEGIKNGSTIHYNSKGKPIISIKRLQKINYLFKNTIS